MLSTVVALTSFSGAPVARSVTRAAGVAMETREDLKALAVKCNPTVGYWDPLDVCEAFGDYPSTETATVGWFRHAEIKHGRVAMAAFVGFIVQSNGICFPWNLTGDTPFSAIAAAGGPAAQWDALPTLSKLQILGFIGLLELWGEGAKPLALVGEKHYMAGGRPGVFPSFKAAPLPHPVPLDLWDPFGFTKKMSDEKKAKSLVAEINNGRLAMIGTMGFMAASKGLIVPGMDKLGIAQYDGEIMAPFAAGDSALPFVSDMLGKVGTLY